MRAELSRRCDSEAPTKTGDRRRVGVVSRSEILTSRRQDLVPFAFFAVVGDGEFAQASDDNGIVRWAGPPSFLRRRKQKKSRPPGSRHRETRKIGPQNNRTKAEPRGARRKIATSPSRGRSAEAHWWLACSAISLAFRFSALETSGFGVASPGSSPRIHFTPPSTNWRNRLSVHVVSLCPRFV